jgi:hypothetical protein
MNLSAMKSLLETGGYSSVADLVTDFGIMMSIFTWINNRKKEDSAPARRLTKCFCRRMDYCPTGPDGEPSISYDTDALKLMATQMTIDTTQVVEPWWHEVVVVSIEDSDESGVNDVSNDSNISHDELESHSSIGVSDLLSSVQDEPLPIAVPANAKTPEPEDLDDETRQLQKEIEERQRKLAKMAEKRRLLTEIKNLDIKKAGIEVKIPETEEQLKQLTSKTQDYHKQIDSVMDDGKLAADTRDWYDEESMRLQKESERLQQESEIHRLESIRFRSEADECQRKMDTLLSERKQVDDQRDEVLWDSLHLHGDLLEVEDQRALAKKKLEELALGTI